MKLLIVEDSEVIRKDIIGMLKPLKAFIIFEADNGVKALEIFEKEHPDIIILDLGLPYLSGLEVLRKIKSINTSAKVIVFTNHAEKYFIDICMKYGADYFFDKSSQIEEFMGTVKSLRNEYNVINN